MSQDFPRPARDVRDIKAAPTQARPLSQSGSKPLKVILAVLSVVVLLVSGTGYALVGRVGGDLNSVGNLALGNGRKGFKDDNYNDGALDILLVGSDSRTDAQGNTLSDEELAALHAGVDGGEDNTDTIMVIRIPEDGSRATAISIPRDTYVDAGEGFGNMKINGVYSSHKAAVEEELGADNASAEAAGESAPHSRKEIEQKGIDAGRQALLAQVKDLTGIEIDHYAEVGLVGFVLLTDAVGGVDVCLNDAVDDPMSGARFPAGQQTLNGAQGLAFVRQRYELPRGDLDRIVRQQAYAASLVSKLLSSGTLTSPAKLNDISRAIERSVVIDENWDVMKLVTQLSGLAGGNVTFTTIPVTSIDGVGDYGESIVTVDKDQVHAFFEDLARTTEETSAAPAEGEQSGPAAEPAAPGTMIHVLNAGSISGLAGGVGTWLSNNGYEVELTSNAEPGIYSESQIVTADADDPRARELSERLGGLPVTVNEGLDADTLIVVTAEDYAGPMDEEAAAQGADDAAGDNSSPGTPGSDLGGAELAPKISAGGDGPRCVN